MKKVLVTGAGGYIGRHVVKNLLDLGTQVVAVDFCLEGVDDRATKIKFDIFSGDEKIYEQLGSPDVCLHMAWKDGFIHNSNAHMEYISSHFKFINNMINGGLKHIAVMGTMHEVGYFEGQISENTPTNPISMYGIAKDSLRRSLMLLLKNKNIIFQWLRAYYIYGDDLKNNSIFAKIIQANEEGKKKFPFNTGKNKYDFIHVNELATQLSLSVIQSEVVGVINCCSGMPITLAEKVEAFIRDNKLDIELEYGVFPDREYDSPAVWGDNEKIKKILSSYRNGGSDGTCMWGKK